MAHDAMVHDVIQSERSVPDPLLGFRREQVVTFMVGANGPFTLTFKGDEFSPEKVNEAIAKKVDQLRAIGAIPPHEG